MLNGELTWGLAGIDDTESVVELVNLAYRGEASRQGWTTEADLLDGRRTDVEDICRILADQHSMILLCKAGGEVLGSVHVRKAGEQAHIGMLAVRPSLQGRGIGKQLLQLAEQAVRQRWRIDRAVMSVIPSRQELIAFYERRGYRRSGISKVFPDNPALWTAKVDGLRLELLEKTL